MSTPSHGDQRVDPGLKALRVVFDQPMSEESWSVVGGGPKFPKLVGKAHWEDARTFVWNWRLEPEHDYWLSINAKRFTNFRGTNGQSALPYPIEFRTARALGTPEDPSDRRHAANHDALLHLRQLVDQDYSHRDLHAVDWPARFESFAQRLEEAPDPTAFAKHAAALLEPARDVHLWFLVGEEKIPSYRRQAKWNIALNNLEQQIPNWHQHNATVATGQFPDRIRYVFIREWPAEGHPLQPALKAIAEAGNAGHSLIIDVRANGGGSEATAEQVAGCFVDQPVTYARHLTRRNGAWNGPFDRVLEPNPDQPVFRGRVAVLIGPGTVSSSESFVMMMKQVPGSTLLGERTAGSSGNPQPVDLGNGVTAYIPVWKNLRLDGTGLEGEGVAPDRVIQMQGRDDRVLKAALAVLRE